MFKQRGFNDIYVEAQAFLWACDSAPRPPPHLQCSRTGDRPIADGRIGEGAGVEPNHTTARKLGPLQIIQSSLVPTVFAQFLNLTLRGVFDKKCLPHVAG